MKLGKNIQNKIYFPFVQNIIYFFWVLILHSKKRFSTKPNNSFTVKDIFFLKIWCANCEYLYEEVHDLQLAKKRVCNNFCKEKKRSIYKKNINNIKYMTILELII